MLESLAGRKRLPSEVIVVEVVSEFLREKGPVERTARTAGWPQPGPYYL